MVGVTADTSVDCRFLMPGLSTGAKLQLNMAKYSVPAVYLHPKISIVPHEETIR